MMPMYKWERYLPEISVQDETWAREFCKIVPKLILWNKSACEAGKCFEEVPGNQPQGSGSEKA